MGVAAVLLDNVIDLVGARIARRAMRFVAVASVQISIECDASIGQRAIAYRRVEVGPQAAEAVRRRGGRRLFCLLSREIRRVGKADEANHRHHDRPDSLHHAPNVWRGSLRASPSRWRALYPVI